MRRKQHRKLPASTEATIEALSHDGRGIARLNGKITFIQGALPDERVRFQYLAQKRDYDEGFALEVVTPALNRVKPRCPHYALCGGCALQHADEALQLSQKQSMLMDVLSKIGHVTPETRLEPLSGTPWHYRHKARLSVRFVKQKSSTLVGFRERYNPRYITDIQTCPVLHADVDAQIPALRALIDSFSSPDAVAQIEVAAGDESVALIFRHLSALTSSDEEKLRQFAKASGFLIFLQPGNMESVYLFYPENRQDDLSYSLPDFGIRFLFHPTDFTQVNAGLNRKMVQQAIMQLELNAQDKLLDLFCGLGNFSLPIAKHGAQVTGVEGSMKMVERARMNAKVNGLEASFFYADLEAESALLPFVSDGFNKVLLDPPRAGALSVVKDMHHIMPERIVYVSCNPATLARDAEILVHHQGYRLTTAGVINLFPHTAHVESMAVFVKG